MELLTTADNFCASCLDNNLTREPLVGHLILDHDLVLSGLNKASKDVNIFVPFILPILLLSLSQFVTTCKLGRQSSLRQVHSQHLFVIEWYILAEAIEPVVGRQAAELTVIRILHTLRYSEHGAQSAFTLPTQFLLDLLLIQEEVEHANVDH